MNVLSKPKDYFEIFSLPAKFDLDMSLLDTNFRDFQRQVHPDKSAHLGEAERRLSLQWATLANEAYQTLKKPVERASYLLRINGVETNSDGHAANLSQEFLIEQMEWREELQETIQIGNLKELGKFERKVMEKHGEHMDKLGKLLDDKKQFEGAATLVKQIRFLDRILEEINHAYEMMEV